MMLTQEVLLDLESKLEKNARHLHQDDVRMSRLRLLGYLDGLSDMRIELSRYLRVENFSDIVQESEVEMEGYNTDLIRVIVEMHNEVRNMRKEVKALLMLVNQIKIFGGEIDAKEFFGKDA